MKISSIAASIDFSYSGFFSDGKVDGGLVGLALLTAIFSRFSVSFIFLGVGEIVVDALDVLDVLAGISGAENGKKKFFNVTYKL